MRKVSAVVLFIMFLILIPQVQSLSVSPPKQTFEFEPGLTEITSFKIYNNRDIPIHVVVELEDDAKEYVNIIGREFDIKSQHAEYVDMRIKLPESLPPGNNKFHFRVHEEIPNAGSISATIAISGYISINVPYPGEYLKSEMVADDVRVGESVPITMTVTNDGTDTVYISKGVINIWGNGVTDQIPITFENIFSKETVNKTVFWETTESSVGIYTANSILDYEGGSAKSEAEFKVGDLLVNMLDVVAEQAFLGSRAKLSTTVESKWNEPIEQVYIEAIFNEQTTKSSSETVPAWGTHTFSTYLETAELEVGEYEGTATLHYANKTETQKFTLTIQKQNNMYLIFGIVLSICVVALIMIIYFISQKPNVVNVGYSRQQRR
jgi:hypothetical protein